MRPLMRVGDETFTGTLPPRETKMKLFPLAMDIYVRYILDHAYF